MKFLVDNALSPQISNALCELGYDSVHVGDVGLHAASDSLIFTKALDENRIIISADTDFGTLLALWNKPKPSFILFRRGSEHRPSQQVVLLQVNLPNLRQALEEGCIAVIEQKRIRIRTLPIGIN